MKRLLLVAVATVVLGVGCGESYQDKRTSRKNEKVVGKHSEKTAEGHDHSDSDGHSHDRSPEDAASETPLETADTELPNLETVKDWFLNVSLGSEYGEGEPLISLWKRDPVVSVSGGLEDQQGNLPEATGAEQQILGDAVDQINGALASTSRQMRTGNDGDIKVYFAERDEFSTIAEHHGFSYVEGNSGFFSYFPDENRNIQKAYILIDSSLSARAKMHMALEELVQVLGPGNDSDIFERSIFYETPAGSGSETSLGALDKRLLEFLYSALEPGWNREKVAERFDAEWSATFRGAS